MSSNIESASRWLRCKCGGRNGVTTHIRFKAIRTYSWDGQDGDTDNYTVTSETNARCSDCDKPVKRNPKVQV